VAAVGGGFEIARAGGLTLVRCTALELPGLAHAFSGRDVAADAGGRSRFLLAAGLEAGRTVELRQVHGSTVVRAATAAPGADADGALWLRGDPADPAPAVRTADCVPLLLASRDGRASAAIHAGWRGVAAGIVGRALAELARVAVGADRIVAALGPAIGPCCYEVGDEVAEAVGAACGGSAGLLDGRRLDLRAALGRQLEQAGVPPSSIHASGLCTRCREDLFFSHRRDGAAAGRMLSTIGAAAPALP